MKKILLISGHPNLEQSLANKTIIHTLKQKLPKMHVRRLDVLYPDFQINVAAEQAALIAADMIIWQFPLHWYSLPALMKKWLDDTHIFGFAHGTGGDKLHNKKLFLSFTTGASEEQYAYEGAMHYPLQDFLPALRQTVLLCGMEYQQPVVSHGMMYIPTVSSEAVHDAVLAKAQAHAEKLVKQIQVTCHV